MKVQWTDFSKQSKRDLKACELLYAIGDYGYSAYHIQQSLEKHIKAILWHGNLMPERKTHLPIASIMKRFVQDLRMYPTIGEKHNVEVSEPDEPDTRWDQFLNESQIMMTALTQKKPSFKIALWKNSLGITLLDEQEEKVFQQCPLFRDYYGAKTTQVILIATL